MVNFLKKISNVFCHSKKKISIIKKKLINSRNWVLKLYQFMVMKKIKDTKPCVLLILEQLKMVILY